MIANVSFVMKTGTIWIKTSYEPLSVGLLFSTSMEHPLRVDTQQEVVKIGKALQWLSWVYHVGLGTTCGPFADCLATWCAG